LPICGVMLIFLEVGAINRPPEDSVQADQSLEKDMFHQHLTLFNFFYQIPFNNFEQFMPYTLAGVFGNHLFCNDFGFL